MTSQTTIKTKMTLKLKVTNVAVFSKDVKMMIHLAVDSKIK